MQNSEHVLTDTPPPADARLNYGKDQFHFGDLRLPHGKGSFPAAMFVHGGFWRAGYDLQHAGFLCAGLTKAGFVTWNIEYRRVGNPGGGWPGSFEDVTSGYQFLRQLVGKYPIDTKRMVVMGHSAGGQLALALAAHHNSMRAAVSLAGVVNLHRAWELHLSHDAVAEFLGGPPERVRDHYREASPAELDIHCKQLIVHGLHDDTVPVEMSREYVRQKTAKSENITFLELPDSGHYELIDPKSTAWPKITGAIAKLV
ncbi:MAG TPA: alpha/beta hydrolase [Candidatus Sulfotelmatobacter sp.]|nr:alpha/beta hydrolase [Candidatus Sulfotelmatobacter sp.]